MKKILSVLAVLALMASQTSLAQAGPIETSTRSPESRPTLAFMPDAVGLLNQLTMDAASEGLGLEAAFAPAQDDTTPPRIGFLPPVLFLYPSQIFNDFGTIVGASIDTELPYIVALGSAAAYGGFNVYANGLETYFDYVQIPLPNGEIDIGIGFVAVAYFEASWDYYVPSCPCGHLEIFTVDFAGNTSIGGTLAIGVSF
jgi:hypothetical protein